MMRERSINYGVVGRLIQIKLWTCGKILSAIFGSLHDFNITEGKAKIGVEATLGAEPGVGYKR